MSAVAKLGDHVIKNGQLIPSDQAVVPVALREVQYGFQTYESLRVLHGEVVHLEDHLERLRHSCDGIKLVPPCSYEDIGAWVHLLIESDHIGDATMKIQVYGGPEAMCFVMAAPLLSYPESYYRDGVKAITYHGERLLPTCKTGNLLLQYMALEEAKRQGGFEAILVDRKGDALEGTRSNFYAFHDGKLFTAPDEEVLGGVTRSRVLKACKKLGIEVVFRSPKESELDAGYYDEAFISATSMAAMPVTQINKVHLPGNRKRTLAICKMVRDWELTDN